MYYKDSHNPNLLQSHRQSNLCKLQNILNFSYFKLMNTQLGYIFYLDYAFSKNFYNMSFKNTYKSSFKQFLLQLAKMYDRMCTQLFTFENTQPKKINSISAILQKTTIKNSIDRKVRIQNELQLFRQSLNTIQAFNHKKNIKRSEVAIKFISATQVLVNRINSQVVIGKQIKTNILSLIQRNKQQFLKVCQKKSNQPNQLKRADSSKVTDEYVLKFAYTETTRPTTAAMSRIQSALQTPEHRGTLRPQTHKNIIQESFENSILRQQRNKNKRRATDNSLVTLQKSKKYKYNKTFCPTEDPNKKINNFTLTQSQSQNSISLEKNESNQPICQAINEQQKHEKCRDSSITSSKISNSVKFKNTIKFQKNHDIQSSQQSQRAAQEQKKSLYYISQNYLKSTKKIDGNSYLNKKKHKVSACIENNDQVFEDTDQVDVIFKQVPTFYKSRKFVTRKEISDQLKYEHLVKSQKSIPRCSAVVITQALQQALQKNKIKNQIAKISKFSKIKDSQLVAMQVKSAKKITLDKDPNHYNKKQCQVGLRSDVQNEIKQIKPNPEAKTIKQIYNELINVRKDFVQKLDPDFRTFSSFFNQQLFLQQQENRRIQKLVKQSKNCCYLQEFQMLKQVTKLQRKPNIYREQAFLAGIRGHLKTCDVLGQIDPKNNQI